MAIIDFTTPQGIKRATYIFSGMIVAGRITFEQALFILERAYKKNVWKGDATQLERVMDKIAKQLEEAVWAGEQWDDFVQSGLKQKQQNEKTKLALILRAGYKLNVPKVTK